MSIIPFIILIIVIILWITERNKQRKSFFDLVWKLSAAEKQSKDIQTENKKLQGELNQLTNKYAKVSKYEGLVDIEAKGNEIIIEAKTKANELLVAAQEKADVTKAETEKLKKQSEVLFDNAKIEANKIIEKANKKAEEIAGKEAFEALNNQKEIEKTAKAIKNIIDGYGNLYLIPTYSLLDDLTEEFGHTEAGQRLKAAKDYTINLIQQSRAAKCDYAEMYRRTTAINFVLDAFNGKVDSILVKIKKDNYGILEQKIKDAFQVVNNNGKAFRDAVITKEYLDARLNELKWAVVVQELKLQEQEEQRAIREQIREEEKARKEYEKAIKEAQKEEETLKRLIEKAQKEVSQATEEQKAKFEEQLKNLEQKLIEAEEKNQRALSMAQQTKMGNVYIISNIGSFGENVYKIGMTRRLDPNDRVRELGDASVPFEFDIHAMIKSDDAPALEKELHKKFIALQMNKVNPRKEFFKISLTEIKSEIDKMNILTKWTLAAEARQYRESLAIEKTITNDKQKREEWEKSQLELDSVISRADEEIEA